uniref:Uncharacterized protein n=1 Tax=Callorhinchus milii TaxID=7868 RepID=A0A4W3JP94_CALMI
MIFIRHLSRRENVPRHWTVGVSDPSWGPGSGGVEDREGGGRREGDWSKRRAFRQVLKETREGVRQRDIVFTFLTMLKRLLMHCFTAGKVAVSKIVDYLRHTTSRSSEDSGLEDLCNMLDPNNQDISIDLDTYHAVMKEWIEECRRKSIHEETPEVINPIEDAVNIQDGLVPGIKLSDAMNGTAGSLEAFGGEISKGDLESSDLISCIADLQYNNHKLQEQNCKLRLTVDAMEETNHRLMEGTEELQNQIKSAQQSVLKEKSLKEELEEMKANMSHLEDRSEKLLLQNKQMAKDNQSLISQIGSLQEENIGNAIEMDDLHKRIAVLTDDKEKLDKNSQVGELTSTIEEYSLIIEALRTEKNNLENQMLLMQQELAT